MALRNNAYDQACKAMAYHDHKLAALHAQLAIAEALMNVASALEHLGTGNAATEMGAIELLAKEVKNGLEGVEHVIRAYTMSQS